MDDVDQSKGKLIQELKTLSAEQPRVSQADSSTTPLEQLRAVEIQKTALGLNQMFLALQYAGATIASSLDLQFVLRTFSKEMVNLLNIKGCVISEWHEATGEIRVVARYGPAEWWPQRSLETVAPLADMPLVNWVLTKRQAQYLTVNQADLDPADWAYLKLHRMKTLLLLPMEYQGRVVGLVEVMDDEIERKLSADEIAFTQLLANQAATAVENARLYEKARQEIVERIETERQLRRATNRIQAILNAIPDAMFILNRDGQILDCRINSDDMLAWMLDQTATGQYLNEVFPESPEFTDRVALLIQQTLHTKTIRVLEYSLPSPLKTIEVEVRLVASGSNECLALFRDITERKQTEQQLIRSERLAALGQLAAALAHEINNPLQSIQSYLDLMLKYPVEPADSEEYLSIIHRQIERVRNITQHVLNFARPQVTSRQEISIVEVVEQVLVLVNKQLEQSNVTVELSLASHLPAVFGSPDHLSQVFLNIVINAIEALPNGGQLHIAVYAEQKEVAIAFTSNSPAIPSKFLPHLFEPFFTTKPKGSGLGLWIGHMLVEQHGGSLSVENLTDDQGVVFTVRLPAWPPRRLT